MNRSKNSLSCTDIANMPRVKAKVVIGCLPLNLFLVGHVFEEKTRLRRPKAFISQALAGFPGRRDNHRNSEGCDPDYLQVLLIIADSSVFSCASDMTFVYSLGFKVRLYYLDLIHQLPLK